MSTKIHQTAIVDSSAEIGKDITIGPFAVVEGNVKIDNGTQIGTKVNICSGARIGKDCRIFHSAIISEIPQDLKFKGEKSVTIIGDRTQIREFATIHRGTKDRRQTTIGSDCLLMAYTHVAHDCIVGNHVILGNMIQLGGHAIIDDWVIVGGMVGVHQFTHIGKHAFIGGGFRCVQDVPPYVLVSGEPLKYMGLNVVGLRRRGFSNGQIRQMKDAYRLIYRSEMNIGQAVEQIESGFEETEEIREVVSFIRSSSRGIIY